MKKTLMAVLLASALAGCGGDGEAEREAESGRGTVTCEGSAMSGATGLPADFPEIEGITFVESEKTGPTQIVDGYVERGLEDVYEEFNSEFESASYTILFHEIEEDDAEVSYRRMEDVDDALEGQVALRSCNEDKTSVHITARPAA
jgi:hypothetical protein